MRFTTNDRLIEHLIGDKLYSSADAAVRELLQNAEDACALQRVADPAFTPEIRIEFSRQENWFCVSDNGIGMDQETCELSFADIGAAKDNVPQLRELLKKAGKSGQIAYFGIGILSCFGVADGVELHSKPDNGEGISYRINDIRSDFEELPSCPDSRGTTIKLHLKTGGPMKAEQVPDAVSRFARHVSHMTVYDSDNSTTIDVTEQWNATPRNDDSRLTDPAVRDGYLALGDGWNNSNAALQSELILCNGGFLVSANELGLLPNEAFGFIGEIDLWPGALSALMSREGFQKDSSWAELSQRLKTHYVDQVHRNLLHWNSEIRGDTRDTAITRALVVLTRGPAKNIMTPEVLELAKKLLPKSMSVDLWGGKSKVTIAELVKSSDGVIYYMKKEDIGRQVQEALPYGGGTLQLTEQISTESIRARHLQLRGHTVVSCSNHNYIVHHGGVPTKIRVHEQELLAQECQSNGITLTAISDVPDDDVGFSNSTEGRFLSDILELGEGIKFVDLEGQEAIIRDFTGRLLNYSHPDVKEVLKYLPDAVGNPVLRELLQAWMEMKTFRTHSAEKRLKRLLTDPDLRSKLAQRTGTYTREYVTNLLEGLLREQT